MLINYFLKDKLDPLLVLPYQNIASLVLSLYSFYVLMDTRWYDISILNPTRQTTLTIYDTNNTGWLDIASPKLLLNIIFTHAITDIFFVNNELKIHHICVVLIITYEYFYNTQNESIFFVKELLCTEISTIFYVVIYYLQYVKNMSNSIANNMRRVGITFIDNATIYNTFNALEMLNMFIFFATFFYTRVYNYYFTIIMNPNVDVLLNKYYDNNIVSFIHIYSGFFGLYLLNLYWFTVMCKKMYKLLFSKYNCYIWSEWVLQYFYMLNIPIAAYVYGHSTSSSEYYILDMIGIVFLSITSYYYHRSNYQGLIEEGPNFNMLDKSRIWYCVSDNFGITLRAFGGVLTKSLIKQNKLFTFFTSVVFIQNIISLSNIIFYLLNESLHNSIYSYSSTDCEHSKIINFLIGSIVVADTLTISIGSNRELIVTNCLIVYVLILVMAMKPFYKFNHVVIHSLLLFETYNLCKVVIS